MRQPRYQAMIGRRHAFNKDEMMLTVAHGGMWPMRSAGGRIGESLLIQEDCQRRTANEGLGGILSTC
jgi:hypothetical protein